MDTVLLGEAPKRLDGFAFDSASWTTQQLADAIGVNPFFLNRRLWLMNVFDRPQNPDSCGFDEFPMAEAVGRLRELEFPFNRVICVGRRVSEAFELAFGLPHESIPQDEFRAIGWGYFGMIPHPSSRRWQLSRSGSALPRPSQVFLREAAGAKPPPRRHRRS